MTLLMFEETFVQDDSNGSIKTFFARFLNKRSLEEQIDDDTIIFIKVTTRGDPSLEQLYSEVVIRFVFLLWLPFQKSFWPLERLLWHAISSFPLPENQLACTRLCSGYIVLSSLCARSWKQN